MRCPHEPDPLARTERWFLGACLVVVVYFLARTYLFPGN